MRKRPFAVRTLADCDTPRAAVSRAATCAFGACLHCFWEAVSERLNIVPAEFSVIDTRRPKYADQSYRYSLVEAQAQAQLRRWPPPDRQYGQSQIEKLLR